MKKKIKKAARRVEKKKVARNDKNGLVEQPTRPQPSLPDQKVTMAPQESSTTAIGAQDVEVRGEETTLAVQAEEQVEDQANPPAEDKGESIIELLGFYLTDEEYAIDIRSIKEIIKPVEITEVPRTSPFVKGIISLRGLVMPIFDLRKRIGLAPYHEGTGLSHGAGLTKKSRVVVASLGESTAGLMVDSVTEVIRLKKEEIEPPPATVSAVDAEYIKGIGKYKGRMIILLDLERIVRLEESLTVGTK